MESLESLVGFTNRILTRHQTGGRQYGEIVSHHDIFYIFYNVFLLIHFLLISIRSVLRYKAMQASHVLYLPYGL